MAKYIYNEDIQKMTFNQLAKALVSGELTEKRLRSYYTDARRKAVDRNRRVQKSEFGRIAEPQRFMALKNLPTQSALLHEIADVNRYLSSKRSTISGQRALKENYIETAQRHNLNVDDSNYFKWIDFLKWFKESAYALAYDSDSEELETAFEEGSDSADWERIFNKYERKKRKNRRKRK